MGSPSATPPSDVAMKRLNSSSGAKPEGTADIDCFHGPSARRPTAVGTWLLFTDPNVAGEVAADGSFVPLVTAIAETLGKAIVKLLVYL